MKFKGTSTTCGPTNHWPSLIGLTSILSRNPTILSARLIISRRSRSLLLICLAAIIFLFLLLSLIGRILIWVSWRWLGILLLCHRCLLCWWIRAEIELEVRGHTCWWRRVLSTRLALGTDGLGRLKGNTSWLKGSLRARCITYGKLGCLSWIRGRLLLLLLLILLNLLISLRCTRLLLGSSRRSLWPEAH